MIQHTPLPKYSAPVPSAWQPFVVDNDYRFIASMNPSSSRDYAVTARHTSGEICSVKKFTVGSDLTKAKACLRELKMLRHLRDHKTILCAYDMDFELKCDKLEDVYLYTELPRSNLGSLLSGRKVMSRGHVQFILYQLLCALNYVHSAEIIHGNVRPENVLINPDTSVRLCDFSNARAVGGPSPPRSPRRPLDAVLYEAPEILLGAAKTSFAIDIWSVGCILAETLNGTPIFDRKDLPGQIRVLIDRLGTPPDNLLPRIASSQTAANLRAQSPRRAPTLGQFFTTADPSEMNVLQTALSWDPSTRNKASTLLNKPYFAAWRSGDDEAVCPEVSAGLSSRPGPVQIMRSSRPLLPWHSSMIFTFKYEQESSQETVNNTIITEVTEFRKIVRQETASKGSSHSPSLGSWFSAAGNRCSLIMFYWGRSPHHPKNMDFMEVSDEDGEFEWEGGE